MIFNKDLLEEKVVGFHYCLMTFVDKQNFKGGRYGEGYSLEELRELPFTNYEELSIIVEMFEKMHNDGIVPLGDYEFKKFSGVYTASYMGKQIISINENTLTEVKNLIQDSNSDISKTKNVEKEFHDKANSYKQKYNCHELSDCDVLLFTDSNNEWKLQQVNV